MPDQLYKLLKKRGSKPLTDPEIFAPFEIKNPQYATKLGTLVSDAYEVGIEVEVENVSGGMVCSYPVWQPKTDGSLRNNGIEFVTYPISSYRISYALNYLYDVLGKDVHFSPRTSIHIHLNVLDFNSQQIAALLLVYLTFEKLFYKFAGKDRDKNNFCVPLSEIHWLQPVIKQLMSEAWFPQNYENHRYMGVNIDSLRKFGTLEFRHLPGTFDKTFIFNWINLIMCLKKYVEINDLNTIKDRIQRLNTDSSYSAFFNDVFGIYGGGLDRSSLQKDMATNVTLVKRFVHENSFLQELQKKAIEAPNSLHCLKMLTEKETAANPNEYFFARPLVARRRAERPRLQERELNPDREARRRELLGRFVPPAGMQADRFVVDTQPGTIGWEDD